MKKLGEETVACIRVAAKDPTERCGVALTGGNTSESRAVPQHFTAPDNHLFEWATGERSRG